MNESFRANGYRYIEEAKAHGYRAIRVAKDDLEEKGPQVQAEVRQALSAPLTACMTKFTKDHLVIYPPSRT